MHIFVYTVCILHDIVFSCMHVHIMCLCYYYRELTGVCSAVYPIHYDSDPWNV